MKLPYIYRKIEVKFNFRRRLNFTISSAVAFEFQKKKKKEYILKNGSSSLRAEVLTNINLFKNSEKKLFIDKIIFVSENYCNRCRGLSLKK